MINAMKYTEGLVKAGLTKDLAEEHMRILMDVLEQNLASKMDLKDIRHEIAELRSDLRKEMAELRSDLREDMAVLRSELRLEISELRSEIRQGFLLYDQKLEKLKFELLTKLGSLIVISMGVLTAILKLT